MRCLKLKRKMSWITNTINSSIGRKFTMALTGLFLVVFLIGHLVGNISLLFNDGGLTFNAYAHFMKHNPIIKIGEVVMFLGFIIHIYQGICLVLSNKAARKQGYAVPNKNKKVTWQSKAMGPLGVVILLLLVWHLYEFFRFKYFNIESLGVDTAGNPDLYKLVHYEFGQEGMLHVPLYGIFMLAIGFHLSHGFQSAFQSLGLNHKKYTPIIKSIGTAYSIIVPALFAAIPLAIFLGIWIK